MTATRISARNLLRETFATAGSLYAPLLIINSPRLIFAALNSFDNLGSATVAFNIIYRLVAVPFLSGAMIFYTYRSLTRNQVTVGEAFNQANRRLLHLILVYIMYSVRVLAGGSLLVLAGGIALMIPGLYVAYRLVFSMYSVLVLAGGIALITPALYVAYRLVFSMYVTVIDNSSARDSLRSSWELTKGRWWLGFRAFFLIVFVVAVPILLIVLLISSTGNLLASKLVGNVLGFFTAPLMNVYLVLLYLRLRESAPTIQ
ncbi:glycerophosphoryl diester phosphodiesterase membrane domain-containing protein [Microcoleus sp. herbarium2]|uniref:glycerophosphoryl diester phosphodiesterase membrane domain-containing protein n=1 Tax=Microcoleus sp. herbarium2 TaxID=3055433 RepID=UPI002FD0B093